MSLSARVRGGFVLVGVLGAVALAADAGVIGLGSSRAPAAPSSCPASHSQNPYAVAERFITTAVERTDLRSSYALATPSLRHGESCRDWLRGRVPLPRIAGIDWARSGYRPVAGGASRIVLRVFLAQRNAALPASFLMELRQSAAGWQVGSFRRDQAALAPAL